MNDAIILASLIGGAILGSTIHSTVGAIVEELKKAIKEI